MRVGLITNLFLGLASLSQVQAISLKACLDAAVKKNETVADQSELIEQAGEKQSQALAAILPTLSATGSYLVQETPQDAAASSIFPSTQPSIKLTLTQPIFRGLREWSGLRQTNRLKEAQDFQKKAVVRDLSIDVASGYFDILSIEQDKKNLKTQLALFEKRIHELNERIKIGRSRLTEVLTVKANLNTIKSQLKQLKGQLIAARESFTFLTGIDSHTTLDEVDLELAPIAPLQTYLKKMEDRPDLKSADLAYKAAQDATSIARGAHFPSIDLNGNYYFIRFGGQQNVHWDVQAVLTVPLFNGGGIQSKVRETYSQEQQKYLALKRVQRKAEQDVKVFYETLIANKALVEELETSRELFEQNYQNQEKEYRLGLVSNLDVMQSMQSFQEAQRSYDKARFLVKLDQIKLEVISGTF
jgi:outer membrane protein